jgi:hypothetical protein
MTRNGSAKVPQPGPFANSLITADAFPGDWSFDAAEPLPQSVEDGTRLPGVRKFSLTLDGLTYVHRGATLGNSLDHPAFGGEFS